MCTGCKLLAKLDQLGIIVRVDNGDLLLSPASLLPKDLIATLHRHKPELLEHLKRGDRPLHPEVESMVALLPSGQQRAFWNRQMRHEYVEQWDRWTAELLAMGSLPDRLERWPASERYRVAELERSGLSRKQAIEIVRGVHRAGTWH
jgi:hypothetical protein